MENKKPDLIDRKALIEKREEMWQDRCDHMVVRVTNIENAPAVAAYTEEQVVSIIQQIDKLEDRNNKLEKECVWLKSCLNCKIRKECHRHCGKVVHNCDHWEYGDNAVEVVHSMWILNDDGSGTCKHCHRTTKNCWDYDSWMNYCPHCGTKMDGE